MVFQPWILINSGLISYMFFNNVIVITVTNIMPLMVPYFQIRYRCQPVFWATYSTNHLYIHDPTQTGWATLPWDTSHIFTSLCLGQQHSFFLECPPLFYGEVCLLPSHSLLHSKNDFLVTFLEMPRQKLPCHQHSTIYYTLLISPSLMHDIFYFTSLSSVSPEDWDYVGSRFLYFSQHLQLTNGSDI